MAGNSDEQRRRGPGRPFQPGVSGNISGRRRGPTVSSELLRQGDPVAVARYVIDLIASADASPSAKQWAIEFFAERTEGKVEQAMRLALSQATDADAEREQREQELCDSLSVDELRELHDLEKRRDAIFDLAEARLERGEPLALPAPEDQ